MIITDDASSRQQLFVAIWVYEMRRQQIILSQQGFTLIEAIVAVLILAIGILSTYAMSTTTIKGNTRANSVSVSSSVLSDKMEELMSLPYDDPLLSTGAAHAINNGLPRTVSSLSWTVKDWKTDTIDNDGDGGTDEYDERGVKEITLTVTYRQVGKQKTHVIKFLKAQIYK